MPLKENQKKLLLSRTSKRLAKQSMGVIAKDSTVSRTLKKGLKARRQSGATARKVRVVINTGYFWAEWYHDGRKAIEAKPGKWLAFWRDVPKAEDPRLTGGHFPKTKSEVRKLREVMSDSAFKAAVKSGRLELRKSVGAWGGNRFFPRAFRKQARDPFLSQKIDDLVEDDITKMLDGQIGTSAKKPIRKQVIRLKLDNSRGMRLFFEYLTPTRFQIKEGLKFFDEGEDLT